MIESFCASDTETRTIHNEARIDPGHDGRPMLQRIARTDRVTTPVALSRCAGGPRRSAHVAVYRAVLITRLASSTGPNSHRPASGTPAIIDNSATTRNCGTRASVCTPDRARVYLVQSAERIGTQAMMCSCEPAASRVSLLTALAVRPPPSRELRNLSDGPLLGDPERIARRRLATGTRRQRMRNRLTMGCTDPLLVADRVQPDSPPW
jgi:hypothetical protein